MMTTKRKKNQKNGHVSIGTGRFQNRPSLWWVLKIYLCELEEIRCAQVNKSNDSIHDLTDAGATEGDSVSEEESLLIPRQRRQRAKYTSRQLHELEVEFERNPYPNAWDRETLAHKLGIHETRIQVIPDSWMDKLRFTSLTFFTDSVLNEINTIYVMQTVNEINIEVLICITSCIIQRWVLLLLLFTVGITFNIIIFNGHTMMIITWPRISYFTSATWTNVLYYTNPQEIKINHVKFCF